MRRTISHRCFPLVCLILFLLPGGIVPVGADQDQFPDKLEKAAKEGDRRAFQSYLMKSDPRNPRRKRYLEKALVLAMRNGHGEIVSRCVRAGADMNADIKLQKDNKQTPLIVAVREGRKKMVDLLVSLGADLDVKTERGRRPIHIAAVKGHSEVLKQLLKAGADVDAKTKYRYTPLVLAINHRNPDLARILLDAGAGYDPDNGERRRDPLREAVKAGMVNTVRRLLTKGADPNDTGETRPVLHDAVRKGNQEIIGVLLQHGADPNLQNRGGETALHVSVKNELRQMIRFLLKAGANPFIKNKAGETPLDVMDPFIRRSFLESMVSSFLSRTFDKPPPARRERVRALIDQLGARSYVKRERAQNRLVSLGEAALYDLKRNYRQPNPEVRRRVRQILRRILLRLIEEAKNPRTLIPKW